jgi:hypothetical protein
LITERRSKPDRLVGPADSAARRHLGPGDRNGWRSNLFDRNYGFPLGDIAPGPLLEQLNELSDKGSALVRQQSDSWPDDTKIYQAVGQKIGG